MEKKVPVVGRVSMNLVTLDVTEINNLNLNDDVLILGSTDSLSISPKDIASKLGTIDYEIVTRIHPGIVRKLI
jgi:alanine racemase